MSIFVTGGTGYIGSHTVLRLIEAGLNVIVLDNLCNSSPKVVERIKLITGHSPLFIHGDVTNKRLLRELFFKYNVDAVIHFAGYKSVSEGDANPLKYYDNNVHGCTCLLEEMEFASIKKIVFSSSATVYGKPQFLPYTESHPLSPVNVYGRTKLMAEQILRDLYASDTSWRIAILRYFNPVGAHISGLIGEDPFGTPNNLMPFLSQVAVGRREFLSIYGDDYNTEDGTGKRDFIHVDDLACGHIAALEYLNKQSGLLVSNLGTGKSTSVMELIRAFEVASNKQIPYKIVARRNGDLPEYYANPQYAKNALGWVAKYDIDRMCADVWRWQSLNPNGYQ